MIGLVDFLTASEVTFDASSTKIHLACWNGKEHPIDVYYTGEFGLWQEFQRRRNFSCSHVLSLIDLGQSLWLYVGIYVVHGCEPPNDSEFFRYSTSLQPNQEELIGRVVVRHQRTRQSYIWLKPEIQLPIAEVRREKMTIGEFPGYNSVIINHAKLRTITRQRIASWHGALANIKGVYLITDTTTGKHYVGKTSGQVGIWQRWCDYAENGHGGNIELVALLKEKGAEHMQFFQYSILEIADTHASEQDILKRESYWMETLRSSQFGLN
ncbi:GIY-YIG nuclease family protein [Thalassoroseus pseudoceratinae]|uniref:GIY-YIG nuclease family protein n=1 Tax=Thalassoroseus pseudoceratinae TaxID=2713176 RepID=UPI0014201A87|nr:GIY-YIG nuclease family protein [Thalassoroseus pseudoceratinae]